MASALWQSCSVFILGYIYMEKLNFVNVKAADIVFLPYLGTDKMNIHIICPN